MNFDLYEFLKYHNGNKFYPVKVEEIDEPKLFTEQYLKR